MRIEFRPTYVRTFPSVTVGDSLRVAGIARVVALSEETVDVTAFGDEPGSVLLPGDLCIELQFTDFKDGS